MNIMDIKNSLNNAIDKGYIEFIVNGKLRKFQGLRVSAFEIKDLTRHWDYSELVFSQDFKAVMKYLDFKINEASTFYVYDEDLKIVFLGKTRDYL